MVPEVTGDMDEEREDDSFGDGEDTVNINAIDAGLFVGTKKRHNVGKPSLKKQKTTEMTNKCTDASDDRSITSKLVHLVTLGQGLYIHLVYFIIFDSESFKRNGSIVYASMDQQFFSLSVRFDDS